MNDYRKKKQINKENNVFDGLIINQTGSHNLHLTEEAINQAFYKNIYANTFRIYYILFKNKKAN